MRKVLLLLMFMFVAFSTSAFAGEKDGSMTEKEVDRKLLKIGATEEQLQEIPLESKIEIVQENFVKFLGYDKKDVALEQEPQVSGGIETLGLAADTNIQTYYGLVRYTSGDPVIKAIATFDWGTYPFWRLTDGFGISWSKGWVIEGGRNLTLSHSVCTVFDTRCVQTGWQTSSPSPATEEPRGGVGWKFNLIDSAYDLKGRAEVYLRGTDLTENNGQLKVWYGHDQYVADLSLSASVATSATAAATIDIKNATVEASSYSLIDNSEF